MLDNYNIWYIIDNTVEADKGLDYIITDNDYY